MSDTDREELRQRLVSRTMGGGRAYDLGGIVRAQFDTGPVASIKTRNVYAAFVDPRNPAAVPPRIGIRGVVVLRDGTEQPCPHSKRGHRTVDAATDCAQRLVHRIEREARP